MCIRCHQNLQCPNVVRANYEVVWYSLYAISYVRDCTSHVESILSYATSHMMFTLFSLRGSVSVLLHFVLTLSPPQKVSYSIPAHVQLTIPCSASPATSHIYIGPARDCLVKARILGKRWSWSAAALQRLVSRTRATARRRRGRAGRLGRGGALSASEAALRR
jgi:hypothetical protein